ncbi:MAG: hypothetical protein MJZ23_07685 [Paludibacteraceae bacterium]|nr:hypothetical protein [Paludibacteraceae bacterium]
MIFKFIMVSDEIDEFRREIEIESDSTFLEFHKAILDAVGYTDDQITSFFVCDDEWERYQEISLVEMDTASDCDCYTMEDTQLDEFLEDEGQKLQYVFDTLNDRAFYIELKQVITGKDLDAPICTKKKGNAPKQTDDSFLTEDILADITGKGKKGKGGDDDFYGDFSDTDGFDDEELGELSDDITFGDDYER